MTEWMKNYKQDRTMQDKYKLPVHILALSNHNKKREYPLYEIKPSLPYPNESVKSDNSWMSKRLRNKGEWRCYICLGNKMKYYLIQQMKNK